MYIPEPGVKFKLVSWDKFAIGRMFYPGVGSHPNGNLKLDDRAITNDYSYDDGSWWTLKNSPVADYYYLINVREKCRMYVNYDRSNEAGLYLDSHVEYDSDQMWQVKVDESKDACQLINRSEDRKLYLRLHSNHIGLVSSDIGYSDQFFQFQQYDGTPVVESITFQLDAGEILGSQPKGVAQQSINNTGSVEQTQTYTVKYTTVKKHSWQHTHGESITSEMGLVFSAGMPLFSSIDQSFKMGTTTEHHWTTEEAEEASEEQTFELPLVAPPYVKVTAATVIFDDTWNVPYEMVLHYPGTGRSVTSYGKWNGMQAVVVDTRITEEEAQQA